MWFIDLLLLLAALTVIYLFGRELWLLTFGTRVTRYVPGQLTPGVMPPMMESAERSIGEPTTYTSIHFDPEWEV